LLSTEKLGETIGTIEMSPLYVQCSELISGMTDDSLHMFTESLNAVDKLRKTTFRREGEDGNCGLVERVQWAALRSQSSRFCEQRFKHTRQT
jgi:hypothetical protein